MADASPEARTVHLRLIAEAAPPAEYEGRLTEFGLKDKKRQLHPGRSLPDGSVQFDLDLQVRVVSPADTYRFSGPFVLGTPQEPFLGLIWNYAGELRTIRGQKLRLDHIPRQSVEQAARRRDAILQATVLPITERTATIPVDWIVLSRAPSEG